MFIHIVLKNLYANKKKYIVLHFNVIVSFNPEIKNMLIIDKCIQIIVTHKNKNSFFL